MFYQEFRFKTLFSTEGTFGEILDLLPEAVDFFFVFTSWADNCFAAADVPIESIEILVDFAMFLEVRWAMTMGQESKQVLVPRGAVIEQH